MYFIQLGGEGGMTIHIGFFQNTPIKNTSKLHISFKHCNLFFSQYLFNYESLGIEIKF